MMLTRLYYIVSLGFILVNGLQIKETVKLPGNLQTQGSNFTVIGNSVFFISRSFQLAKMGLSDYKSQGSLNIEVDGFAFFNDSVGAVVARNYTKQPPTSYFCTLNPSDLSLGKPVPLQGNWSMIADLWILPNSPTSVVYGYLMNNQVSSGFVIGQVDVTTGVLLRNIAPCTLANGTAYQIDSIQSVENLADPSTVLLAIMCYPNPDTMYSDLVFLDVESWTLQKSIPLGVQAALLHVISNDILGYVELINQSSSDQLFQIVAYSVSKRSVIANEVITPYWISQNDTTVVMEAVTDGSGTIYIMRVDFEGSEGKPYESSVTSVTYDSTKEVFTIQGSVSSSTMFFGVTSPDSFILNNILYTWAYLFTDYGTEDLVLIGN